MDWLIDFLLDFQGPMPYLIVLLILLACGLGVPIPEDITLFAGGLACYYGLTQIEIMIAISMLGVLLGDSIIFLLGYYYGNQLTQRWFFKKLLPETQLQQVRERFHQTGNRLIFAARFMPGLRAPIFFTAGALHLPFRVFFFYDGLAALLSVPAIIGAVYFFGDELERVVRTIQRFEHGLAAVLFALLGFFLVKFLWKRRKNRPSSEAS